MTGPGSYEPVGGWSGRLTEDAPPPAPVPITETVIAPAALQAPREGHPSFLALIGSFFIAAFFIEVLGELLFIYVFALILASNATFDATGSAIFISVVWTAVSVPIARGVIQLVLGWSPKVYPLAVTMFTALGVRYALEGAGGSKLAAVLVTIPLQAGMMLALPGSFTRATPNP